MNMFPNIGQRRGLLKLQTKKQAEKVEQFANFSQVKVYAYRGDVMVLPNF